MTMHPLGLREHICAYSGRVQWTSAEIKRRREAKGWSQQRLADAVGASRRAVTNWETGVAEPQGRNLRGLERALGDEPEPDVLLRDASNLQFAAEMLRRLSVATTGTPSEQGEVGKENLFWLESDAPVEGETGDHSAGVEPEEQSR